VKRSALTSRRVSMLTVAVLIMVLTALMFLPSSTAEAQEDYVLRVSLYAAIPDAGNDNFAAMLARMEAEYEELMPWVDLELTMSMSVNIYNQRDLYNIFTELGGFQVVEIDTLGLGYLVENDLIVPPTDFRWDGYLKNALNAVTVNGGFWAMPSRICSVFLYGFSDLIWQAYTLADMQNIFEQLDPSGTIRKLIGEFFGVTSLNANYTTFYVEQYGYESASKSFEPAVDQQVVDNMATVFSDCSFYGYNPCFSDYYKEESQTAIEFARGGSVGYMGYSEATYWLLKYKLPEVSNYYIVPFPTGPLKAPLIYTDALAMSKLNCSSYTCRQAAYAFALYYSSDYTQTWIALSEDAPGEPWRYLLSARSTFYDQPVIAGDFYYQQFFPITYQGLPFPNTGFFNYEYERYSNLCKALGDLVPGGSCNPF
jgi:hypothetical protein